LRYINGNANKYQWKKQPYLKNAYLLCEAKQGSKAINIKGANTMENSNLTPEQESKKTESLKFGELCRIAAEINQLSKTTTTSREDLFLLLKTVCGMYDTGVLKENIFI